MQKGERVQDRICEKSGSWQMSWTIGGQRGGLAESVNKGVGNTGVFGEHWCIGGAVMARAE